MLQTDCKTAHILAQFKNARAVKRKVWSEAESKVQGGSLRIKKPVLNTKPQSEFQPPPPLAKRNSDLKTDCFTVYYLLFLRRRSRDVTSDSTESYVSEKDPLSQRFSVSVHPLLPVILSSDGYLVTVMQLPPVASYHGVMTGLMRDVTRCAVFNQ